MRFDDLPLCKPILRAVADCGYTTATPIQQDAIPHVLEGRDLLGCAQTGTGKTAAFALPILHHLATTRPDPRAYPSDPRERHRRPRPIRCLVLTPTRELAAQIDESFRDYGRHLPLRSTVVFGGVGQTPQVRALQAGVDVVVATPGRLLDLLSQRCLRLDAVETFVLDEADRMLDMGFLPDVRRVIDQLPRRRQTLFFSATMPKEIARLAEDILHRPVRVAVTPVSSTAERIEQAVYFVDPNDKRALLEHVLGDHAVTRALVFTRTKHGADRVARHLEQARMRAVAIHGNKSQGARERALSDFKEGRARVLVATDIAARGLDVDDISHVINFDLPNVPESYVHRIGRTARAGREGVALSLCGGADERGYLRDIERLIGQKISEVSEHPFRRASNGHASAMQAPRNAPPRGRSRPPFRRDGRAPRRQEGPSGFAR
jgi:ATP-dependent RNA helicase RhlE